MLTAEQKAKVRLYLGYPDQFRDVNVRLEGIFGILSAEAEALIVDLLTKLATVETAWEGAMDDVNVKKVDEIEFHAPTAGAPTSREQLASFGRTHITRISTIVGVPPYADYFGTQGYPGDNYSAGMPTASGRGVIRIG